MDKDTDIVNHSLDDVNFCLKTYLLILSLKQFISNNNSKCIIFFTKNIIEEKIDFKNIIYENGKLFAYNKFEKIEINPEDYILQGLEEDITNYYYYPLKILLLRNESYKKFLKDGEKGFLYSLNLYEDFKNYFKNFIESQFFNQLLENVDEYKNIAILLINEEFKEELLNETHLRFLPFYGSSTYFGYTNKDIMISFINSIPEITKYIRINKEKEIINVTNICLLFTIAVKFITALHEFIIHLTYSYLNFITKKKIDATSKKESIDEDDGGYFFERTLRGDTKFKFLNINNVVNLLDGSFEDNSFQFQNGLKCKFDYEKLISKIKEINGKKYGGFLKVFLSKYDIDFTFFEKFKAQSPTIFCRGKYDVGISMIRDIYDSYIYGGNKKSKK
jgi:hypothetical protein